MKKVILLIIGCIVSLGIVTKIAAPASANIAELLPVRSIDTMKVSRDMARERLTDSSFDQEIDTEVKNIASLGATHVAIATPYDEEFYPFLERWVNAARKYNLHVWFRGNFAGWEGWFNYPKISRKQHVLKLQTFLTKHKDLFMNGDIFTSCPECENGGPGDPRQNDLLGHRAFLIQEYNLGKQLFAKYHLQVTTNYYSMNGDVALLVMDKATTKSLGGVVTVDHYVSSPEKLTADIEIIAKASGGKVVLGETGVPIPDLNGNLTEKEQAEWMAVAFGRMQNMPELIGINYWVNSGGSTALWDESGNRKDIATVVERFYTGKTANVIIVDTTGKKITNGTITSFDNEIEPEANGFYRIPYYYTGQKVMIHIPEMTPQEKIVTDTTKKIVIAPQPEPQNENDSWFETWVAMVKKLFHLQ